jgi:hypothetical protein
MQPVHRTRRLGPRLARGRKRVKTLQRLSHSPTDQRERTQALSTARLAPRDEREIARHSRPFSAEAGTQDRFSCSPRGASGATRAVRSLPLKGGGLGWGSPSGTEDACQRRVTGGSTARQRERDRAAAELNLLIFAAMTSSTPSRFSVTSEFQKRRTVTPFCFNHSIARQRRA